MRKWLFGALVGFAWGIAIGAYLIAQRLAPCYSLAEVWDQHSDLADIVEPFIFGSQPSSEEAMHEMHVVIEKIVGLINDEERYAAACIQRPIVPERIQTLDDKSL